MILLVENEIKSLFEYEIRIEEAFVGQEVAKAQLKKVVEWMLDNELVPSYSGDFLISNSDWQALLKEIE